MAVGMVSYWFGQRRVARGTYDWESPSRKLVRKGLRKVDASLAPKVPAAPATDPTERFSDPGAVPAGIATGSAHRGGAGTDWVPPPGFVSRGLNDPTGVDTSAAPPVDERPPPPQLFDADAALPPPPPEASPTPDQPTLPLEFSDPAADPTTLVEPRWRDSPPA